MSNFYAYRTASDESMGDLVYKELQLHQFGDKRTRDAWVLTDGNATSVKVSGISDNHMRLFKQFGGTRRTDGGFWSVVDSGTN